MFRIGWLNDNRVIGVLLAALMVLNAFAVQGGWYSG